MSQMAEAKKGLNASRLAVNAIASVTTEVLGMSALFWVNQYLLRRISPQEYALIPVIVSLMFFAEFLRIIFTRGMGRFMVEEDTKGDDAGVTRVVSSMLPVLGAVSGFVAVVGGLAVWNIASIIKVDPAHVDDARLMLSLLLATFCFGIATTPIASGLYVKMRFVEQYLIDLGMEVLRIAVLLLLLLGVSTQARWVVVASCTAGMGGMIIRMIYTYRILPAARLRWSAISPATMRHLLSFSLWTSVQGFTNFAQRAAPALFLNRYSTALDVASFHVGNLPNLQIQKLITAVSVPSMPELTALYALQGEAALKPLYYRGGRFFLWGSLFLTPPLIVYAHALITLYVGETYARAAVVMATLLAIYPFTWASAMYYRIAYAIGRIKAYNIYSVALSIAALAGMYLFVAVLDMGAIGAAYGLAAGFILANLCLIWPMGLRLVHGNWATFIRSTLLPGLVPFVAALAACWIFGRLVDIDTWLRFGLGCLLSAVVYGAVLLAACLDKDDRAMLAQLLAKLRRKLSGRGANDKRSNEGGPDDRGPDDDRII